MSQPAKLQEPTMEEILASIRRIIAEDDLRPLPPPPAAPAKPAPPEPAPSPATAEQAPREEMADGFDDPEMSSAAANDVFEQRESPWRPGENIADVEATSEPAGADIDLAAPNAAALLEPPRFAAAPPEPGPPAPPEAPRELPSREPARPSAFEPLKAELAKLELARSEFARIEATKSEVARPNHARPDVPRPELPRPALPRFEWPRRDPARSEPSRPELQEPIRREPAKPDPARPAAAASPPVLRAAEEGLLSPGTTAAVDLAFNTLAQTILVQNSRSLEDLVREMLKPMLKAWLDDNLPGLVERLVRAEIERVSRGRS
jgi:cell pole-organizing protein PopZ